MSDPGDDTQLESTSRPPREPQQGPAFAQLPRLVSVAVLAVAVAVVVYFVFVRSPATSTTVTVTTPAKSATQAAKRFQLSFPKDWKQVAPSTVAPGQHAFEAVRQTKGIGVVVMRVEGKARDLAGAYLKSLEAQLAKAVPDYKFISSRMIQIRAGKALDLTYERTRLKDVRNVVVLPVDNVSIVIATVAPAGDSKTTKEINEIVGSFTLSA